MLREEAHLYKVSIKVTSLLAFENINLRQDQTNGMNMLEISEI